MLKRIPWIAVAVCLLGVSILLTLQQSLYPWPKRLRYVRLEPTRPILRDADVTPDNAFFYLRQLTSAPSSSDDWSNEYDRFCALGMPGGPYPALEARLTEVAGNFELCRQAAALTTCQVATVDSSVAAIPYLGPVQAVVRNLQFRAERAVTKGNWVAAGDDYRLALRTGDHITRGGCFFNHQIVTYPYCSISCANLRRVAIENEPPLEFLRGMIEFLAELDRNAEPFAETMRYDRLIDLDWVRTADNRLSRAWDLGHSSITPGTAPLDTFLAYFVLPLAGSTPRRTARHLDNVYSYTIDIAAEQRPSGRSIAAETLGFLANGREPLRLFFDDPVGRMLVNGLFSARDSVTDKYRVHVATLRGTELALALRLYQRTHDGKLPARLDELVPDCLAAVPVDPFSRDGEGFLYRVDAGGKWIVYSRGPNLRDDGAAWNYFDDKSRSQHRDSLDVILSAAEPEQRRDNWRLEHPGEK